MNAELLSGQFETRNVRRQQICQEHRAEEITAWENRQFPVSTRGRPIDQKTSEIAGLRLIKAFIDLREGADKNQDNCYAEADNGQLQRSQNFKQSLKHLEIGRFGRT